VNDQNRDRNVTNREVRTKLVEHLVRAVEGLEDAVRTACAVLVKVLLNGAVPEALTVSAVVAVPEEITICAGNASSLSRKLDRL